ncbi:MAG: helix-turn-helix transcriptional regulator [Bacteroidota bacterium]
MIPRIIETKSILSEFVRCYWTLESDPEDAPVRNKIVPDGCMKMIFHYGDPYRHHPKDGAAFQLPRSFVVGQLTTPYEVEPEGKTGTFFVCFRPNGFIPFSTIPIKEMENKVVSLEDLYDNAGDEISEKILNAADTDERIEFIEAFLTKLLTGGETIDHIVKSTVDTILSAKGQLSVNELSDKNNVTRRHLARKFSETVGISPKQLSKTIRLQAALKILLNQNVDKLTDLAYQNEYYDQAHFIKDFKEFTGLTPKEFYGNDLKMSLIFDTKK